MSDKKSRGVPKPTVSIVGAGRLGTALALGLAECGYKILAMVSRRVVRARTAAALINSDTLSLNSKQLRELPASDLILITTPDDAIQSTAQELSSSVRRTKGATV
ncbi:MAG: NAD(P)-binding domain-containing protein, partial [Pyrinomonadaceae bacterium]